MSNRSEIPKIREFLKPYEAHDDYTHGSTLRERWENSMKAYGELVREKTLKVAVECAEIEYEADKNDRNLWKAIVKKDSITSSIDSPRLKIE